MYYRGKRINDWLADNTRPTSLTKLNMKYLGEMKECSAKLGRISCIAYLLTYMARSDVISDNLGTMLHSSMRQRNLCKAVCIDLKKYGVRPEDAQLFERTINAIDTRCNHVFRIIKENVRLTEYHPYFEAVGYDRLMDYAMSRIIDDGEMASALQLEMASWNSRHKEEIERYKASIADEVAKYEQQKQARAAAVKEEKRIRREAKRAEDAEVREIRENEKKYRERQRKIEKSFDRYYK